MARFTNLFVVYNPEEKEQPALERAARVAGEVPVTLHVFACIFSDIAKSTDKSAEISRLLAEQRHILERAVAPLIGQGVKVSTEVEWDKDWCAAVIRASIKSGSDLVIKSTFKHSASKRKLAKTCDITLIRGCLCPVLLVKEAGSRDVRKVLAAVDVLARAESYERLNKNVFDFGKQIADTRGIEVHYINSFEDFRSVPSRQELSDNHDVESDNIHIKLGSPDKVIVDLANELDVDMVVVGNSARSGLPAAFLGNTVEKVLDKLECDVLSMP